MGAAKVPFNLELADQIAEFYDNPFGFVRFAYPWGERGSLEQCDGPDAWQRDILLEIGGEVRSRAFNGRDPVAPLRMATASGHGIGKSTLVAWLVNWILSTRPYAQGTVTANTFPQLESKTWAAVRKWTAMCITSHWFHISGDRVYHVDAPASWFCTAQTCREENSEAFAGQHAAESTSFYIFDEASAVPSRIWEVAEGGLTDGEPMFYAFGNPTRREGAFYSACFGSDRKRWISRSIDSRTSMLTNKEVIEEWREQHGEDSDFFRVRVRGLPPSASDLQFIDSTKVYAAQNRAVEVIPDEPLILGVDLSRGGADSCCFRFRRGLDARTIPPIHLTGEESRNSMTVVTKLTDILDREWNRRPIGMCFIDETGLGGAIVDRVKQLGYRNVMGVQFGGVAPDRHYANMRSFMWSKLRDWLDKGAIPNDPALEIDLTSPGFHHNRTDQIVLESKEDLKKRDLDSPDDGDALALTFAQPVRVGPQPYKAIQKAPLRPWAWG